MNGRRGKLLASIELKLADDEARKVVQALCSETCFRILQLLSKEKLDVSTIARRLNLSQAHISGAIGLLEDLKLIDVNYAPGKRGIRKICEVAVERILIVVKP
jgi:predicted transcriptional regulator